MKQTRHDKITAMRAEEHQRAARKRNVTVTTAVIGVFVVVLAAFFLINRPGEGPSGPQLVRADSHRLQTAADGKVTLVEFLDFECEGCRAYFPVVEELRKAYTGKVTFIARYFPISSHYNAERAARAVEAAAQQGKFEGMYKLMYERQTDWAEQRVPADHVFRGYAEQLKLDVAAWEKAYRDPATLARVKQDADDGLALGVEGTPTFFLNGQKIQPRSAEEFKAAIDAALNA
ncbi:DsbA family protein [Nonomuraea soli]|uniref:Protein-disulfide isomerase n=1 Tax=Nonomuraea soli TaxID=1032476 RepID=A0A7W0HQJ1_9ACTN|nr:thioredoxin domain-containing protein [Nonomuraea soli]MBA2891998.1 protein-disulfide isomerase [Nonomuraea soli]